MDGAHAEAQGVGDEAHYPDPAGSIGRLLAINDKPLTPEQRKQDDERLNQLLDPGKMREKAKSQKEDEQRTLKMLRAMPAAFIYKYAGTETTPQGQHLVRLDFTPNPDYVPPSREVQVFQGMRGQVWIDSQAVRIAKIDGTLFRDVNFGWGILGRLYKGGRFVVEQAQLANGYWDTVHMQLKFDGKILMFKSLHIEEIEHDWDFRPVPKMDVQQALNILRSSGDQIGQGATSARRQREVNGFHLRRGQLPRLFERCQWASISSSEASSNFFPDFRRASSTCRKRRRNLRLVWRSADSGIDVQVAGDIHQHEGEDHRPHPPAALLTLRVRLARERRRCLVR